jgi:hypothetical protein
VTYLRPAPAVPIVRHYAVPASARVTVWVDVVDASVAATDVSMVARVLAGPAIIAERAMYRDAGGRRFAAGHNSAGVPSPALTWFFAEGATGAFFDLFLLLANPGPAPATVELAYLLPTGARLSRTRQLPPASRVTIWVDREAPELVNTAVSVVVTSTNGVPIVAERAMWWPGTSATWHEAHASAGSVSDGVEWALADGQVGGARGAETYVLLANVSPVAGEVDVRLLWEDGSAATTRRYRVAAHSRTNVPVAADFPSSAGRRFGVLVTSQGGTPARLVVERSVYWDAGGERWAAGTNALAARLR